MKGKRIDGETFVRAWESSKGVLEVAKKLNMARESVAARAGYLRSRGVKLKKFNPWDSRARLDVEKLNKIIEGGAL